MEQYQNWDQLYYSLSLGKNKIIQYTKKFVSTDVKPSAGFKRKTNPAEGGKWKIASRHWNMDGNGDVIINSSSFWFNGRKLLNFSTRGIGCN